MVTEQLNTLLNIKLIVIFQKKYQEEIVANSFSLANFSDYWLHLWYADMTLKMK